MISRLQTAPTLATVRPSFAAQTATAFAPSWSRLVRVGLALFLLPALLVVLLVGTVGMVILAATSLLPTIEKGSPHRPRRRAGLESFRA